MSEDYRNSIQENLKRGTTDMVILYLLSKEDMYGYQLNQKITELSKNRIVIKEGCLYPPVYRMESKGFLCKRKEFSPSGMVRNYFHITEAGREYLNTMIEEYKMLAAGIEDIFTFRGVEEDGANSAQEH